MEARVARIESDVSHIKSSLASMQVDTRELRADLKAANEVVTEVRTAIRALDEKIESKIDAKVSALESKLLRWMVATVLAVGSAAFALARFVHPEPGAS